MKKFNLLILLSIVLFSCKKYKEDSFISTYSPESRIKNTSANIWILEKYVDENGFEKNIDKNNYNLKISKDSLTISSLNSEFINQTSWSFQSNKQNILTNGNTNMEILKLAVDKMRLKNDKGQTYWFKKVLLEDSILVATESVIGVPLFGLFNGESSSIKLTKINNCEVNNINVVYNNNTINTTYQGGLFGNGFGINSTSGSISYNFSNTYSKPGYLTFYYKNDGNSDYNFVVKVNGIQVPLSEGESFLSESGKYWKLVRVPVNSSGNINFSIQSSQTTWLSMVNRIDEIKFWEYE